MDFLHVDANSEKLKMTNNYWLGIVKNSHGLVSHGSLKSAAC